MSPAQATDRVLAEAATGDERALALDPRGAEARVERPVGVPPAPPLRRRDLQVDGRGGQFGMAPGMLAMVRDLTLLPLRQGRGHRLAPPVPIEVGDKHRKSRGLSTSIAPPPLSSACSKGICLVNGHSRALREAGAARGRGPFRETPWVSVG